MDAINAILESEGPAALAVIVGIEGPSYRPLGAMMAILPDEGRVGTLSSGCIENDIALHGTQALRQNMPLAIRYGRGSPFVDIQLPCGGGLDILLIPNPNKAALAEIKAMHTARKPCGLEIDMSTGKMGVAEVARTEAKGGTFAIRFEPELQFLVFGKGPESSTFASLVQSAGYPNMLLSPDEETLADGSRARCQTRHLTHPYLPEDLIVDPWTAIVLFFHDHDWEPPILAYALETDAFYIGAQGSQKSRDTRHAELTANGVKQNAINRLRGPIGLIPSARDARTLSVSVLSEILKVAQEIVLDTTAQHSLSSTVGFDMPKY